MVRGEAGSAMTTAGVIGLGDIGKGVAEALVTAGIDLVVCDVRPEATAAFAGRAEVAASPAELGAKADVVLVAVVNDAQVLRRGGRARRRLAGHGRPGRPWWCWPRWPPRRWRPSPTWPTPGASTSSTAR